MTDQSPIAARASLLATLNANLAELVAAIPSATGYIMAWPTGLGVRWNNGEPVVCGVLHADRVIDAEMTRTVQNGAGETARLFDRKTALEAAAASIRESIAFISEGVA